MFTREEFTKALEEVVEGKEDYVYREEHDTCRYVIYNEPACLIGHVMHKLNILDGVQEGLSAYYALKLYTDEETRLAARAAQRKQDDGGTWGAALEKYREELAAQERARLHRASFPSTLS